MDEQLTAPFPYYGGKRRAAPEVWRRFGQVETMIEPFGGSLAVTLACPWGARPREIVNDLDGFIPNFWRAVVNDPAAVARYADWHTSHLDLIARKRYCLAALPELQERLMDDADWFDAKVAGYWVWCVSNDIGLFSERIALPDLAAGNGADNRRPSIKNTTGGRGVAAQAGGGNNITRRRPSVKHNASGHGVAAQVGDKRRPHINTDNSGLGVAAQGLATRPVVPHKPGGQGVAAQVITGSAPHIKSPAGGQGITAQRRAYPEPNRSRPAIFNNAGAGISAQTRRDYGNGNRNSIPFVTGRQGINTEGRGMPRATSRGANGIAAQMAAYKSPDNTLDGGRRTGNGDRLLPTMNALADRLFRTYILCKDWQTLCSPSVLGLTPSDLASGRKPYCGIFLDPPYATAGRGGDLYRIDSLDIAHRVKAWAIRMGSNPLIRIALCGYRDDYDGFPEGWTAYSWSTSQIRMGGKASAYSREEVIWFSPHCLNPADGPAVEQGSFMDLLG